MKHKYAAQISENDSLKDVFLVKSKTLSMGKTGKPYLVLSLMDKTGDLEGRVWDNADAAADKFDVDDFIKVGGTVSSYLGKLQLKISHVERVNDSDVNIGDFLPTSEVSPDEMFAQLQEIVETVKDENIKDLLAELLGDDELSADFKKAPAAKGMHHVYIGGLLEHVLSICRLIDHVCAHYGDRINRDILIAGAIFHDIGKTRELSYLRSFGYTDEGRLIGHITIGVEILDNKIRAIEGFPQKLSLLLKHMILSHHGEYEYGSPKRPKTVEATILSYLDDLDAKVNSIHSLIDNDKSNESDWTGYHRLFERYIYKINGLDEKKAVTGPEDGGDHREASGSELNNSQGNGKTMPLFGS